MASTHSAFFGGRLVFSCFHVLLIVYYSRINFSCFLLKLYNLQKHENIKTLNYHKKVHSLYSPLNGLIKLNLLDLACKVIKLPVKIICDQSLLKWTSLFLYDVEKGGLSSHRSCSFSLDGNEIGKTVFFGGVEFAVYFT
jgi:hypothetical protein